jgi:hypothetical protein
MLTEPDPPELVPAAPVAHLLLWLALILVQGCGGRVTSGVSDVGSDAGCPSETGSWCRLNINVCASETGLICADWPADWVPPPDSGLSPCQYQPGYSRVVSCNALPQECVYPSDCVNCIDFCCPPDLDPSKVHARASFVVSGTPSTVSPRCSWVPSDDWTCVAQNKHKHAFRCVTPVDWSTEPRDGGLGECTGNPYAGDDWCASPDLNLCCN